MTDPTPWLLPKIDVCRDCGKKPKEIIWQMGFSDKDDELYLVHYCAKQSREICFPEIKKHPFTAHYVNGQRPLVRAAWNELQSTAALAKETKP